MKNKKILIVTLSSLIIASLTLFLILNSSESKIEYNLLPRVADSGHSAEFKVEQKKVIALNKKIKENPEEGKNYLSLAQIFLEESRITGNHHYYIPRAEQLVDKALNINNNDFEAMIIKSSIYMTYHQFHKAKNLIQNAIHQNSYNAFAYGVLTDALVELGKYDKAVEACDKMLSIRPDLRSYARASYLREIHGQTQGAIQAMVLASDAGVIGQENRAWTLYNLGNLFLNMGKLDSAEYIYKGILEERPGYGYALSGLADIEFAKENYPNAIEYLVKATHLTPNHLFIEKLADIYKAMDDTENETNMINKVLQSFAQHEKDGYDVDKEYALFCSNHNVHLEEALERAKKEYERRPLNIEALDTYAWALYKNSKSKDAIHFVERALRLNTKKSLYYYHAAAIYDAAGNKDLSIKNIKEALNINPYTKALYTLMAEHFNIQSNVMASLK